MKNIIINIPFIFLLSFFLNQISYSETYDTTFNANLFKSKKSIVKISFTEDVHGNKTGVYDITIDGKKIKDSTNSFLNLFQLKIVDMDESDDYKELAIVAYYSEFSEYNLYRFDGKKITGLGTITSLDEPVFNGDGTAKSREWMGFWSCNYEYVLNEKKMKYEPVYEDEYPVKFYEGFSYDIIVKESFSTYEKRNKKSDVVTKFKPGDKIWILSAYIKVKCEGDNREACFWYLIKDKDGNEGWLQLKDFQNKVEGIPWAG